MYVMCYLLKYLYLKQGPHCRQTCQSGLQLLPIYANRNFLPLSIRQIHFKFKVVFLVSNLQFHSNFKSMICIL